MDGTRSDVVPRQPLRQVVVLLVPVQFGQAHSHREHPDEGGRSLVVLENDRERASARRHEHTCHRIQAVIPLSLVGAPVLPSVRDDGVVRDRGQRHVCDADGRDDDDRAQGASDPHRFPPSGSLLMIFAGTPPTITSGGTSFVTTAPAATIECSPMVTPGQITHPAPIHTSLQTLTGAGSSDARRQPSALAMPQHVDAVRSHPGQGAGQRR